MTTNSNSMCDTRYDLAVIGGGGAGLTAAVAAAEKGARVIVIEKRRVLGGNSSKAEGFFACESPAQKRLSIDAPKDLLFKKALAYNHYKVNPRIVRAFVDLSGDTVRWLEGMGLFFDWVPPFYPNQVPQVWHCIKGNGAVVIEALTRRCRDLGVGVWSRTTATALIMEDDGSVSGVAVLRSGSDAVVSARSVLVATGGYGANKDLLARYCPGYSDTMLHQGIAEVSGDGICMALEAGAGKKGLGVLQTLGPAPNPKNWTLEAVCGEPNMVWVNSRCRRFIDESVAFNEFEAANAILEQPDAVCFALFDERIKTMIVNDGVIKGLGQVFVPPATRFPDLDSVLHKQAAEGGATRADNWGEIARWIGSREDDLERTVEEYNACCDDGRDDVFAKERRFLLALRNPPFYAVKCGVSFLGTIGGILINERMEVLSEEGVPIPGLYAAGVDTGGWESDTYCVELSGSTFGFALNSGRIAAWNACSYVGDRLGEPTCSRSASSGLI